MYVTARMRYVTVLQEFIHPHQAMPLSEWFVLSFNSSLLQHVFPLIFTGLTLEGAELLVFHMVEYCNENVLCSNSLSFLSF